MTPEDSSNAFDDNWNPEAYLETYYNRGVHSDERQTYEWVANILQKDNRGYESMLEVGSGPTVHNIPLFIPYVGSVDMSDYLENNLAQIRKWVNRDPKAHDWSAYIGECLRIEQGSYEPADIEKRADAMRQKIRMLRHVDLSQPKPLGDESVYPLVTAFYCMGGATKSIEQWQQFMGGIMSLVAPKGRLIITDFKKATSYHVGEAIFPNATIDEHVMASVLKNSGLFRAETIEVAAKPIIEGAEIGISEFLVASATRIA